MFKYSYCGPVMAFGRCVADHWEATTYAPTEQKAKSNFAYRYKQENGLVPKAKIDLPAKIIKVD